MTRLVVTANADDDATDILDYLAREAGEPVAQDYGQRFARTIERLVAIPESGTPRPRLGPNTRLAIVFPYLLVYDYAREDDTVHLLRILHGKRNISADLLKRLA